MRYQVKYKYPSGKQGLKIFDIHEDASIIAVNKAAKQTAPAGTEVLHVTENTGKPPYDEVAKKAQPAA